MLSLRFEQVDDPAEAGHQVAYTALEPERDDNTVDDGPGVVVLGMPGWSKLDPREQEALVNKKWPSDIARQREQVQILKGLLKERK